MISPRGPNEKIIAIEVVNGGETSGSNVAASITRTQRAAAGSRGCREGEQEAERRADDADQRAEQQAVAESARWCRLRQHAASSGASVEPAVVDERARRAASASG